MTKKVLVVEDDRDTSYLLRMILSRHGYVVTTVINGQEALTQIAEEKPDLVLMDVEMPELNGLETLRKLRADPTTAHLPVVMLTARKNLTDIYQGQQAGADYYLSKPFLPHDIVLFVAGVLAAAEPD